jgi:acetyl-CoA carboxylase carboxyltransferase component
LVIILWANPTPAGTVRRSLLPAGDVPIRNDERRYFGNEHASAGHVKYRDKLRKGKLFVRDRLKLLLDPGSEFRRDFMFAQPGARHAR